MKNKEAPVFLELWRIQMPVTAVISILHRLSGVLLVLALPFLLYLWGLSLRDAQGYASARLWLTYPAGKLFLTLALWAVAYHFLCGMRFLLVDLGVGLARPAARRSAWLVLAGALAALLGIALMVWR